MQSPAVACREIEPPSSSAVPAPENRFRPADTKHLESDVIAELRDDLVEISRHEDTAGAYALARKILEHLRESS
jgi:hypothetical protein